MSESNQTKKEKRRQIFKKIQESNNIKNHCKRKIEYLNNNHKIFLGKKNKKEMVFTVKKE